MRAPTTTFLPVPPHGGPDEVWPVLWRAAAGPACDARKYRDELLWQEHARHLYARLGGAAAGRLPQQAWDRTMACVDLSSTSWNATAGS